MSTKKKLIVRFFLVVLAVAPVVIYAYEYGPLPGYTGAPGDNPTGCSDAANGCHTGSPNTGPGSIKIVASGGTTYVPGQTQQIQVIVTDSTKRKYGFQLSARLGSNPSGQPAGVVTAGSDGFTQVLCLDGSNSPASGCPSSTGSTLQWIEHTLQAFDSGSNASPSFTYSFNWTPPSTNVGNVTLYAAGNAGTGDTTSPLGTNVYLTNLQLSPAASNTPSITTNGVVPIFSTATTIEPDSWISIYGNNLAATATTWTGNFPNSLGGTSVTIDGKPAFLWFVSPGQINLQVPDDTNTGTVQVVVTTAKGTATSSVTLGQFGPSFSLLGDPNNHVAGVILRNDGSGAYSNGSYDIIGPTGTSLGYKTVAAKAGDTIEIFGVGFGPTNPSFPAGQTLPSGSFGTATNPIQIIIGGKSLTPSFAGITEAGLYQFNLTLPSGLGTGDVSLEGQAGGVMSPTGVVIALQ